MINRIYLALILLAINMASFAQQTTISMAVPTTSVAVPTMSLPDKPYDLSASLVKARAAFEQGNYPQSVEIYTALLNSAPNDPGLLYNLGLAQLRNGHKGEALWRWVQAYYIAPRDPDIQHNIQLLSPEFFTQIAPTPIPPLNWLFHTFNANEWAAAAFISSVATMLLTALYIYLRPFLTKQKRLFSRKLLWLMGALAFFCWPFAIGHYVQEQGIPHVIVVEESVARTGPSDQEIETYPLPLGSILRVLDESVPGWIKFSYADGRIGFVHRRFTRSLDKGISGDLAL